VPQPPFVVVGASTGLGRATALRLLRDGHRVLVAGRDVARTEAAVPTATALRVDLTDLADVRRFTAELVGHGPLAGIICNAGVQVVGPITRSRDGHEETFAVNHLAHFAIVLGAAAALAPAARVLFVGSSTLDPDDRGARMFGFRGGRYTTARELAAGDGDRAVSDAQRGLDRYATSKLCNLLAMDAIARRTQRFAVLALDPGLMAGTGLARDRGLATRIMWHTVARLLPLPGSSSARRSGAAMAWLATDASLAGTTNRYFDYRRRELERCAIAKRQDWADELYTASVALAGLAGDPLA
jgi:NAD(P)-dependent dehydrogenase (short-subunit alcohol dehydrogenase family)